MVTCTSVVRSSPNPKQTATSSWKWPCLKVSEKTPRPVPKARCLPNALSNARAMWSWIECVLLDGRNRDWTGLSPEEAQKIGGRKVEQVPDYPYQCDGNVRGNAAAWTERRSRSCLCWPVHAANRPNVALLFWPARGAILNLPSYSCPFAYVVISMHCNAVGWDNYCRLYRESAPRFGFSPQTNEFFHPSRYWWINARLV